MNAPIYLDHHATTPVDPAVKSAMLPYLDVNYGNASSKAHRFGWTAQSAVDEGRAAVARLVGAVPKAVVFTSGATESINTALMGLYWQALRSSSAAAPHFITMATEHAATLDTLARLEQDGAAVDVLPVRPDGRVDLDVLRRAFTPHTVCVSASAVNNEVGTVHDIAAIGALCGERGVPFHCDAVQAVSTLRLDVERDAIDLLSLSAHKMYGPKGMGALYIRPGLILSPLITGGGQERGRRAGTLNVPGIVGFGVAADLAFTRRDDDRRDITMRRERLLHRLDHELGGVQLHGVRCADGTHRVAANVNVALEGVEAERLLLKLASQVALSTGSACASHQGGPSHVLAAMGVSADAAHRSVRIGLGRTTTDDDVERAADCIIAAARALRDAA